MSGGAYRPHLPVRRPGGRLEQAPRYRVLDGCQPRWPAPRLVASVLSRRLQCEVSVTECGNREAQLEMIDWVQQGGLPGLTDPDVVADARR